MTQLERPFTAHLNSAGDAGLTVKPQKCQIAMNQCIYLDMPSGNEEVHPEATNLKPWELPLVRELLELTGY